METVEKIFIEVPTWFPEVSGLFSADAERTLGVQMEPEPPSLQEFKTEC